jgi:peptide/nickel transport system substrate-binding protein
MSFTLAKRFVHSLLLSLLLFSAPCTGPQVNAPAVRVKHPLPDDVASVATSGRPGGELRYPLAGEPRTFNYLASSDSRSKLISYLTTGTLLEFDAVRQEVRNGLCKRFELSEDGRSAYLELREGLRFSDGVPCTTRDVIFTFESIYREESANILKDVLLIEGEPLNVRRVGEQGLELEFPVPFAAADYVLSTVPVLPSHLFLDSSKKIEEYWTLGTPPKEMAGLGPFVVQAHEPGLRTVLQYNPHYWKTDAQGIRLPYLDRIMLEYTHDRSAQLLRFKAGELDLLDQLLRPEDMRYLQQEEGIRCLDVGPSSSLTLFWFNLNEGGGTSESPQLSQSKKNWFSDPGFRRAISYAIGRKTIVQNVYLGLATESVSFIPVSNRKWYAPGLDAKEGGQAEARRLLEEAGYSWDQGEQGERLLDGDGKHVEFRIVTRSDDVMGKILAVLQQDLEALGITLFVQQEETRALIARVMGNKDYDAALMNLDFPIEPTDISNVLLSSGSLHFWNPAQKEPASEWEARVDELMRLQGSTLDEKNRIALFREVQEILHEQRPFIPLVNRNLLVAWWESLQNVNPANIFPFALWNSWELHWESDS